MASQKDFEALHPVQKTQVYDVLLGADFDVSDWTRSSKNPVRYRMNPKYCYNWSFIEPGKAILLNLWHAEMELENARVIHRHNFRADSVRNSGPRRQSDVGPTSTPD